LGSVNFLGFCISVAEDFICLGYGAMSVGNWIFKVQVKNVVEILRMLHCLGMSGSDYPVT